MTTKKATEIVNTMKPGMNDAETDDAARTAILAHGESLSDANVTKVINAYRQHDWDVDDLVGDAAVDAAMKREPTPFEQDLEDATMPKATVSKKKAAKAGDEKSKKLHDAVEKTAKKQLAGRKGAAKKSAKPAIEKKPRGPSRTQRMFEHVLAGLSNEQAVAAIKKEFGSKVPTNVGSIGWCRSQLKAKTAYAKKFNPKGHKVLTDKEAQEKSAA